MTAQEKARKKNLSSKETFQGPAIVLQPVLYVQLNLELRTILVTQFLVLKVKLVLILTVQVSSRVCTSNPMFYINQLQFATKLYPNTKIAL